MAWSLTDRLARQLRLPRKGLIGWVTKHALERRNGQLEKSAAWLCGIQPHHHVLEVGFGPGVGLEAAQQLVQDGGGKVYGAEISEYMLEVASKRLQTPIEKKKVALTLCSVEKMPYPDNFFDRVFHCNCYYFWPSMQGALREISRVMKPGGTMVTTLSLDNLKASQKRGLLKYAHTDPLNYMCALDVSGFQDVQMKYFGDKDNHYQAIFAQLPAKELTEGQLVQGDREEGTPVDGYETSAKRETLSSGGGTRPIASTSTMHMN